MDNEVAREALATGTAKNKVDLMLVITTWAVAARYDVAIWVARVPSKLNPAVLPSRDRELLFETEPKMELSTLDELSHLRDLSRISELRVLNVSRKASCASYDGPSPSFTCGTASSSRRLRTAQSGCSVGLLRGQPKSPGGAQAYS